MQVVENNLSCLFANEVIYCNALRAHCRTCSVYKTITKSINMVYHNYRGDDNTKQNHQIN